MAGTETAPTPAKKATLYDLELARREVKAWIQEEAAANDGELPPWLEALELETEEAVEVKVERMRGFIMGQQSQIQTINNEISRLQVRREVRRNRIDRLERYVHMILGASGKRKIETALGTVGLRGHGGKRPFGVIASIEELEKCEITAPFVKTITPQPEPPYKVLDKDALRDFMEANGADEVVITLPADPDDSTAEAEAAPKTKKLVELKPRGESVVFK